MKLFLFRLCFVLFFLLLMLHPQTTVSGASAGLLLWFHSIIPSLLPFMIFSNLLVALNGISLFTKILHPFTSRLFGISEHGSYALLAGFVCGYPMGAKTCADLLSKKQISREEAQYILCFANNPGPSFLSGYILQNVLKNRFLAPPFFLSVYGAPLLYAAILHLIGKRRTKKEGGIPPFSPFLSSEGLDFGILDHAIMNGFETVTRLGGYIILFSILSAFLIKPEWISLPIKTLLLSVAEITTGSHFIGSTNLFHTAIEQGMAICACISFGGLSGIFQTKSVTRGTSLSLLPYIESKLIISLLSALLYLCICLCSH